MSTEYQLRRYFNKQNYQFVMDFMDEHEEDIDKVHRARNRYSSIRGQADARVKRLTQESHKVYSTEEEADRIREVFIEWADLHRELRFMLYMELVQYWQQQKLVVGGDWDWLTPEIYQATVDGLIEEAIGAR